MQRVHRQLLKIKNFGLIAVATFLCSCQVNAVVTLDVAQSGAGLVTVNLIADSEVVAEAPNLADMHRRIVVAKHAYLDITIKYATVQSPMFLQMLFLQ